MFKCLTAAFTMTILAALASSAQSQPTDAKSGVVRHDLAPAKVQKKPIAYGFILSDGSIASGSKNITATYNADYTRYEITITGVSYYYSSYSTTVTPSEPDPGYCTSDSVNGELIVTCYTPDGRPSTGAFGFTVF